MIGTDFAFFRTDDEKKHYMKNKNTKTDIKKSPSYRIGYQHVINNKYLEMQLLDRINNEKPRVLETSEINENVKGRTYEQD